MTLDEDNNSIDSVINLNMQYLYMHQALQCISMYLKAFQVFFGVQLLLDPNILVTIDLGTQISLMLMLGDWITLVA